MAGHLEQTLRPLRRLWRGARWSHEYGSHPGTVPLLVLVAAGAIAGADRDPVWGPLLGSGVMAALYGPLWLIGCWHRGDSASARRGSGPGRSRGEETRTLRDATGPDGQEQQSCGAGDEKG